VNREKKKEIYIFLQPRDSGSSGEKQFGFPREILRKRKNKEKNEYSPRCV